MNPPNEDVFTFDALGTHWVIIAPKQQLTARIRASVETEVQAFESCYSRFLPDSLLSDLNRQKHLANPPEELVRLLRFALDMYRKSNGLFDISVGARLEQIGYGTTPDESAHISDDLTKELMVADNQITIAPHIRLDFGGFGKGWLVDKVHDILSNNGIERHIVNGGGDIRIGQHDEGIWIADPRDATRLFGKTSLTANTAFAASSNKLRTWETHDGSVQSHIVHPSSQPIDETILCATSATTCVEADVAATALFIARAENREEYSHALNAAYLIIKSNETIIKSKDFHFTPVRTTKN